MPRCIWRSRCLTTSTPRRVESSSGSDCPAVVVGRVRRSRHPAKWRVRADRLPGGAALAGPGKRRSPVDPVGRVRRSRHPAKWRVRADRLPGGAALAGPGKRRSPVDPVGRVRRSRHPAKWRHNRKCPCSHYVWQDHNVWQGYNFYVNSGQIALPVDLLRSVSYGAGSAQGAASRRRPLYPRKMTSTA
ncbi:hypothetical protein AE23_00985 [Klebsiella pneumoniae UCI 64]|nr:hypothetical protein AE23_00985 [Klebsiella pneumoniae UCI 64]